MINTMSKKKNYSRRSFLETGVLGAVGIGLTGSTGQQEGGHKRLPYKIGIRQASLRDPDNPEKNMIANFDTFKVARDIPGIMGVELQVASGNPNMRDRETALRYKAESHRWGLDIPATAGVWTGGPWGPNAILDIVLSLQATELVGASIMLIAFFRDNAPDMSDKNSYGPVVDILKAVAPRAREAGIILGLENSLSPADNKKLVDLIDDPNVQVYYDPDNMYYYGHEDEAVPGIKLLGKERIAAFHVKNNGRQLSHNWRVDWAKAFSELTGIQYEGWLIFESSHENHAECIKTTKANIEFIKNHFQPPVVN
jgi:L-ribulose-5-phosphate 3-epimerase